MTTSEQICIVIDDIGKRYTIGRITSKNHLQCHILYGIIEREKPKVRLQKW